MLSGDNVIFETSFKLQNPPPGFERFPLTINYPNNLMFIMSSLLGLILNKHRNDMMTDFINYTSSNVGSASVKH